jgi:hypothetical protein
MHTEHQTEQTVTATEMPPVIDSGESKPSKRGGRRPGAGRKQNLAKRLLKGFSHGAIAEAVATVDCGAVIVGLLRSKREKMRLETLAFIRDTLIGRPSQNVSLSGGVVHAHTVWRPLASLTDEEVKLLDTITNKLTAPVSNASPNAPQNQTESKPAIEVVGLDVERRITRQEVVESRERAQHPERVVQVSAGDGEVVLESQEREPRSIMDALTKPTREPMQIGESFGGWRRE